MAFTKITNAQLNQRGATTLPYQPTIAPDLLQREFDAPAKEVVAPAFNNLIDELEATSAAANIGINAPTGRTGESVQAVVNDISSSLATVESDIVSLNANEHNHDNKALLDTYTQTDADLAQAVVDDHTHANKALLDTYTQADADIADAVIKKHDHSNKTELDKIGESGGKPTYSGKDISGSIDNSFASVLVGTTTLDATGETTLKLKAGANINLFADPSTNEVEIQSTGGGSGGGGDMLKSVYDQNGNNIVDKAETLNDGTNALTASIPELNHVDGVTSPIQTQLDSKADATDLNNYYTKSDIDTKLSVVVKYAGKKTFAQLDSTLLVAEYVNNFFMISDGGYITSSNINLWNDNYIVGDHITPDSHIAVIEYTGSDPNKGDYVFDDFGGFVEVDEFTTPSQTQSNNQVVFDDLNPNYGYKLFFDDQGATGDIAVPKWTKVTKASGTNSTSGNPLIKLTYTISGGTNGTSKFALRILK